MRCEYLESVDGVVRLTVVFESRADMEKFKEVYDKFAALLPDNRGQRISPEPGAEHG